jgi:hypothetical protein
LVVRLSIAAPRARHSAAVLTHSPLGRRRAGPLSEILATLRLAIFVAALSALIVGVAVGAGWIALRVLQHVVGPG